MNRLGRNDPYWCGSGKKFKNCHLGRHKQPEMSIWEAEARLRANHRTKLCLHPSASNSACSGRIVRAHTVRRSADLKAIARDGHVYQGAADQKILQRTGGKVSPQFVGINEASTFWGFCQVHDTATFAPLETRAFGPTEEQAFLLAYRPLVKELYLKHRQLETSDVLREMDKGKTPVSQILLQEIAAAHADSAKAALSDLTHHKSNFDRLLLARQFSSVRFVCIHFDRAPDIMCSGFLQALYTFGGTPIQDLLDEGILEQFGFSLIATETGGAAVFSWLDDSDAASGALVDSLLSLPTNEIPDALVRFALSELENCFIRPEWWEALGADTQRSLVERMNHNVNILAPLRTDCLVDDGVRAASWKVLRIDQKRR